MLKNRRISNMLISLFGAYFMNELYAVSAFASLVALVVVVVVVIVLAAKKLVKDVQNYLMPWPS